LLRTSLHLPDAIAQVTLPWCSAACDAHADCTALSHQRRRAVGVCKLHGPMAAPAHPSRKASLQSSPDVWKPSVSPTWEVRDAQCVHSRRPETVRRQCRARRVRACRTERTCDACAQVAGADGTPDAVCARKLAHSVRLHACGCSGAGTGIFGPAVTAGSAGPTAYHDTHRRAACIADRTTNANGAAYSHPRRPPHVRTAGVAGSKSSSSARCSAGPASLGVADSDPRTAHYVSDGIAGTADSPSQRRSLCSAADATAA
jgi:hypothetical protein